MKSTLSALLVTLLFVGCAENGSSTQSNSISAVSIDAVEKNPELLDQYPCTQDSGERGVLICHIPPGNFSALHDICIGLAAVHAHKTDQHGGDKGYPDVLGSCRDAF